MNKHSLKLPHSQMKTSAPTPMAKKLQFEFNNYDIWVTFESQRSV